MLYRNFYGDENRYIRGECAAASWREAKTTGLKGEKKGPTNASLPIAFALEVRLPLSTMLGWHWYRPLSVVPTSMALVKAAHDVPTLDAAQCWRWRFGRHCILRPKRSIDGGGASERHWDSWAHNSRTRGHI